MLGTSSTYSYIHWMCVLILLTLIISVKRCELFEVLSTRDVSLSIEETGIDSTNIMSSLSEDDHRHSADSKFREIEKLFETPNADVQVKPHISIRTASFDSVVENDGPQMTIIFQADTYNLTVNLKPTWDLLTTSYEEPLQQTRKDKLAGLPCEWQGAVQGLEDRSLVALSLCPVIRGIIDVDGAEVAVDAAPGSSTPEDLHQLTANSQTQSASECGVRNQREMDYRETTEYKITQVENTTLRGPARNRRDTSGKKHGSLWTDKKTRFVEMVLVADNSYYRSFGDDLYNRLRSTINVVNARFRDLGIVVVLTDIEVWSGRDLIPVSSDVNHTLTLFSPYRLKLLKDKPGLRNDNTVLVTTVDFDGPTVGYAYVDGICSNKLSVSTVQDKKDSNIGAFSRTVAHELGHNLGMSHDNEDGKPNCCKERSCIMSSSTSAIETKTIGWSSCSKEVVKKRLDSLEYECLRNVPTNFYQKTCGNGILDSGEECDCGPKRFCENKCCNSTTCTWTVNATCAHGPCCNLETCQLHEIGETCRKADGDCDLPEFCSGISEYCPADVHVRDGTPCEGSKGYCYKGTCGNPDGKCKRIWGQEATTISNDCGGINEQGTERGNCGWANKNRKTFKKCTKNSSPCGTLQCNAGKDANPLINSNTGWSESVGRYYCKHIRGSDDLPESIWLAPNGAPCGKTGKEMCIDQECRKIIQADGVTSCPKNCSGRGICNSKGNCHCNPGYKPPDCVNRGHGGSYDSNYIKSRTVDVVTDVLLILLAIIIPILAFICCSWEKLRHWWEWTGFHAALGCCPRCAKCIDGCCCPIMTKITHWCVTVGHKKETELNRKEFQQVLQREEASTVCQVKLDVDEQPITNSWGIANERLFTEVVQITPKNSPDISRKIMINPNSSLHHPNSDKDIDGIPTYQHQSISVDSGCVSDDDLNAHQPVKSQMSMTSLIGTLSKFSNNTDKSQSCKDLNQQPRNLSSEKTMPLSRFVLDPLAGKRRSGAGTPPPTEMRSPFIRSMSTGPRQGPGEAPPVSSRFHKSDDDIHSTSQPTLQQNGGSAVSANRSTPPPPPPPANSIRKPPKLPKLNMKSTTEIKEAESNRSTPVHKGPIMPPKCRPSNSTVSHGDSGTVKKPTTYASKGTPILPPNESKKTPSAPAPRGSPILPPNGNMRKQATSASKGSPLFPPNENGAKKPVTPNCKGAPIFPPKGKAQGNLEKTSADNKSQNVKALTGKFENK